MRKIRNGGITILGVRYSNEVLQDWRQKNSNRDVEIRWYHRNIGTIDVRLGGEWRPVPAVFDGFEGLSAQHWIVGLRAQRLRNAHTIAANEAVIIEAMDAIEAVNAAAMKRADVFDFDWTQARVKAVEDQLFIGFEVSQKARAPEPEASDTEDRLMSTSIAHSELIRSGVPITSGQ